MLYEIEHGASRLTSKRATLAKLGKPLVPVAEYLATQSRFKGMSDEIMAHVQAWVDQRWEHYHERPTPSFPR